MTTHDTRSGNGSPEPAGFLDLARRALGRHGTGDALRAVSALRRELDRLEAKHVAGAVHAGWSWSRVARELGVTKQAAHRKHAQRVRDLHALGEPGGDVATGRMPIADDTRRLVQLAREEATALGGVVLGPEHLLLGLLRCEAEPAVSVLRASGVTLEDARTAAAALPRALDGKPSVSVAARATLDRAIREAAAAGETRLRPVFVLLALTEECGSLLERLGADPQRVRAAVATTT